MAAQLAASSPGENEIGANSYGHADLSVISRMADKWIFPPHFYDDFFVDFFADRDIPCTDVRVAGGKYKAVATNGVSLEILQRVRIEAYSALVWYEALETFTYRSELHALVPEEESPHEADWWKPLVTKALSASEIGFPCFVKLDTVSAKDTRHSGVFHSTEELIRVFESSARIQAALSEPEWLTHPHRALFI